MRSLHHHGSQIPVALFADALLWLTLSGVPAPGAQPQKTADLATLWESIRVVDRQDVGQRDLCSHAFDLFEQRYFGIHLLGDLLDPLVVFPDALVERFDSPQQGLQYFA